jgi:hypothetical protein
MSPAHFPLHTAPGTCLPRRFGSQYVRVSGIRVFDFFQEQWLWDSWNKWYPVGVNTHPTAGIYITCRHWLGGALLFWPMKEPEGNFWGHAPLTCGSQKFKDPLPNCWLAMVLKKSKHCFWPSTPGYQKINYIRFGPSIQCPKIKWVGSKNLT